MLPRIRFPSFSGYYTEKSLNDAVLELKSGLSRMFSDSDIGLPVIRSNNIKDYSLDFNELKYWFEEDTQGATTSNYHLRDGDILVNFINSQAQIGKSAIYYNALNRDCIYTTNILSLRINKEYSPEFIFFFFQTKKYNDYIQSITKPAVNQASFTTKDFRKMKIFFPNLTEQTKIANFLCSVDEKIALLNKQYELLCQYKKGMMQKIFSQEVRFKDKNGRDFPKWTMRIFSDFFTIGSSKRVLQDDWVNEGVPFYRTRELVSLSKKKKFKSEIFITEDNYTYLKDKYGVPAVGDFLVSGVGTLGVIYQVKNDNPFYFKDGNVLWFKKNNEISSDFFYHVFNSPKVLRQIVDHAAITTVGTYTIENAKKTKFMCPSLEEQTKIANLLSAMDDKIAVKKAELDKLKTWKQGLLQQMFI